MSDILSIRGPSGQKCIEPIWSDVQGTHLVRNPWSLSGHISKGPIWSEIQGTHMDRSSGGPSGQNYRKQIMYLVRNKRGNVWWPIPDQMYKGHIPSQK